MALMVVYRQRNTDQEEAIFVCQGSQAMNIEILCKTSRKYEQNFVENDTACE